MEIEEDVTVNMNSDLADILLANLISNAVRHNVSGGKIKIQLNNKELLIENTGMQIDVDPSLLFERFAKVDTNNTSPGLGLAIIRKIVELYNMEIVYKVTEDLHTMRIILPLQK